MNASSVAHSIKNDFPEVLKNAKGKSIQVSITGGITEAFTDFLNKKLEDQKTIKSDVGDIIKESKVKIKEPTARKIIKRDFKNGRLFYNGERRMFQKRLKRIKNYLNKQKLTFKPEDPDNKENIRSGWLDKD